jgi:hypothetical protein
MKSLFDTEPVAAEAQRLPSEVELSQEAYPGTADTHLLFLLYNVSLWRGRPMGHVRVRTISQF